MQQASGIRLPARIGGAFDAVTAAGHSTGAATELMIRYGLTQRRADAWHGDREGLRTKLAWP
jgi:hypothetical protein